MDLTEAEDIKKRWQEYTEELYKKDLHDQDNHDGVITHLEPDTLEREVKWALGSNFIKNTLQFQTSTIFFYLSFFVFAKQYIFQAFMIILVLDILRDFLSQFIFNIYSRILFLRGWITLFLLCV